MCGCSRDMRKWPTTFAKSGMQLWLTRGHEELLRSQLALTSTVIWEGNL